jgi:predicted enzyme related to lactoylglutathione lyase
MGLSYCPIQHSVVTRGDRKIIEEQNMANPAFHGRFLWQELRSRDPNAAAGFYTRVMPWKSQPFAPGAPYTVFVADDSGGRMVAGATALDDDAGASGTRPQWLGSIGSSDVDATVAQAVALGARVVQPAADMPNVGRMAVLADPQGGMFGVYKPAGEGGGGDTPHGGYSWHEFAASDLESAFEFYQSLFGWDLLDRMPMGPLGVYLLFGRNGKQEGGMYRIEAGKSQPVGWLPYVSHRSADEAARLAVAAGGQIASGPMDVPGGGRVAQLIDPQGVMFAVHSVKAVMPAVAAKPAAKKPAARKPAAKKRAAKQVVRKARRKVAAKKVVAKKAVRRAARKPARKAARKVLRKVSRRPTRKPARKPARRPARKK